MRLSLDNESPVPWFRQIADQLRVQIGHGQIQAGDTLPSVREAAAALGVNINTVAKAYRILAEEGLVALRQGRGARVLDRSPKPKTTVPREAVRELETWIAKMGTRGVQKKALKRAFLQALARTGAVR